jgi:hypothetical protein
MKKSISSWLKKVAKRLPLIFEEKPDKAYFTGRELKLTAFGETDMVIEDDKIYAVDIPQYIAVLHEQQLKDAYKQYGAKGVSDYVLRVVKKYKSATGAGSYENQEFVS